MGGHGHGQPSFEIPDYRIYKVEDAPKLMNVKRALASQGLHDPWLRNEVWRYHKGFGTVQSRVTTIVFRGFKVGFGAFVLTMLGTAAYDRLYPDPHAHGHH